MVGEFPNCKALWAAIMRHGEDEKIATAIAQHYRPQGPADSLPQTAEWLGISLKDKRCANRFFHDQKPTGSRDPFALRRAAPG